MKTTLPILLTTDLKTILETDILEVGEYNGILLYNGQWLTGRGGQLSAGIAPTAEGGAVIGWSEARLFEASGAGEITAGPGPLDSVLSQISPNNGPDVFTGSIRFDFTVTGRGKIAFIGQLVNGTGDDAVPIEAALTLG